MVMTFEELAASRRDWISNVLQPWCEQARQSELKRAHDEWNDLAGRVDPTVTLWFWAWRRFPDLINSDLGRFDESAVIRLVLSDGREVTGTPDARASRGGQIVLVCRPVDGSRGFVDAGPFSIDEIVSAERMNPPASPPPPPRQVTELPGD